jgi:hypothetical protein
MIIGTDTWLRKDINSSEIFPDSYTVYRKDIKDDYVLFIYMQKSLNYAYEYTITNYSQIYFSDYLLLAITCIMWP